MAEKKENGIFAQFGIGVVLFIAATIILCSNEGSAVKNSRGTDEARRVFENVSSDMVNPQNNEKLIATIGNLQIESAPVSDTFFDVTQHTVKLSRVVERYQWVENKKTAEDKTITYTYEGAWSDKHIDSSDFNDKYHGNPNNWEYSGQIFLANNVKVGAYILPRDLISELKTESIYSSLSPAAAANLKLKIEGNYYTSAADINQPKQGDYRISFYYNNSDTVSLLAKQSGNTFSPYIAKSGKRIYEIFDGKYDGKEMIEIIKTQDSFVKWLLRILGIVLAIGGIGAVFKPLSKLTSKVPVLGKIVGGMVGLIAFLLGTAWSLLIIAIAWFVSRPLLSVVLLACVAGLVFALTKLKKQKAADAAVQS